MLNINIICIGKLKETYLKDAIGEYSKRLTKYCNLNIIELPDEKLPNKLHDSLLNEVKEKECKKIIENIKKDSYVCVLDLKGKLNTINTGLFKNEDLSNELSEVLSGLGYKQADINRVISKVDAKQSLEEQIKEALKLMLK